MNTKQPFAELLAGLQQGKVSLVDIIAALNAHVVQLTDEGAEEEAAEHADD